MKIVSTILKNHLPKQEAKVVEFIAVLGGWKKLDRPTLSSDLCCAICSGTEHYCPHCDPAIDARRVWICANGSCESNNMKNLSRATTTPSTSFRSIVWAKFCEINAIGDENHEVKFEDINQSDGKRSYMLKFIDIPTGILFMQGVPGSGKTYSAMGICEMFTRKSTSCSFMTQKQMYNKWLDDVKGDGVTNYSNSLCNLEMLVVDDFGTGEISPGFMGFFMDIINTRMQWKNRGTVVTTNLNDKDFGNFCGDALFDRINSGQKFIFKDGGRRKKKVL